jgi:small subunit ribosomal protein S12
LYNKKKKRVHAFIPGEKNTVVPNNHVLIRGGRVKDIPGMKYTGMRGFYDLRGVVNRKTARSKYGVKRTLEMKREAKKPFIRKLL